VSDVDDPAVRSEWSDREVADEVRANRLWYHTLELRPGIITPGWFDLRPITDRLPFPDVRGKRCLDIGTFDGHFAFLMEKRGADEVVATDISRNEDWDWAPAERARGLDWLREHAGEKGRGFEIAARALGSSVKKLEISVYDLSPDTIGTFDVVVCGSLLLHLRDPFRALEAIHGVCNRYFLSCEQIDLELTLMHRSRAVTRLGPIDQTQWHVPNLAAHRLMVSTAGFTIERAIRPYSVPFGVGHRPLPRNAKAWARRTTNRLVTGFEGVPHSAALARVT
jgi:tRNA (mo5U34)-methyltransferase